MFGIGRWCVRQVGRPMSGHRAERMGDREAKGAGLGGEGRRADSGTARASRDCGQKLRRAPLKLQSLLRGPCHAGLQMAKLTDEHRRALQVLAREPVGCAEVALLAQGFSVGQLATLVMDGFAKRRPIVTNVGGQEKIVLWMQITDAGRAALAE
jgi:hypothetical protein